MGKLSDENPKSFADWIGQLIFFVLVGMAVVIFISKMRNESFGSKDISNASGMSSNREKITENPEPHINKRFNF